MHSKKNKLLINLNPLRPPLTGIGYYTKNIVKECLQRDVELVGIKNGRLLCKQDIQELILSLELSSSVNRKVSTSFKQNIIELLRKFPGIYAIRYFLVFIRARKVLSSLAKNGFTYFEPSFVPMRFNGDIITTIHDLSFITYPDFHPIERVNYLKKMVKQAISVSKHIMVDSNFIKKELLDNYSIAEDKVSTVYLGVEHKFKAYEKEQVTSTLTNLNIEANAFILSVATLEPRKNLTKLVEAYRNLPVELKNKYPLVLVGNSGWKNSSLVDSIQDLVDSKHIIVTGYLSDTQLNHVYSSATLFVYPSIYEGFGLPVIEAMASGTAVITSNCGATAEVAGESALLVSPTSAKAITDGMSSILEDDELRGALEKMAVQRASLFTWKKCTDDILSILNK